MSTARQKRDAARAKLEAHMAEKAARAKRNRRIQVTLASVLAVVLVAGVGVFFYNVISNAVAKDSASESSSKDKDKKDDDMVPAGDGQPAKDIVIDSFKLSSAESSGQTSDCKYKPLSKKDLQKNTNVKDVGAPKDGPQPASGSQQLDLKTSQGNIKASMDNKKAPCTAASFSYLAKKKFLDDSKCHRLTTENLYVLQCGDPTGTGQGGPTYNFDNEYAPKDTAKGMSKKEMSAGKMKPNYDKGVLAMANSGADTNGSQFFIVYKDTYLPPDYTIFGKVTDGLDVVEKVAKAGAEVPKDQQQQQMPTG